MCNRALFDSFILKKCDASYNEATPLMYRFTTHKLNYLTSLATSAQ